MSMKKLSSSSTDLLGGDGSSSSMWPRSKTAGAWIFLLEKSMFLRERLFLSVAFVSTVVISDEALEDDVRLGSFIMVSSASASESLLDVGRKKPYSVATKGSMRRRVALVAISCHRRMTKNYQRRSIMTVTPT